MGCLVCRWSHTLPVIIVNDPIEFVTSFIYLVSKVSKTSDLITEINRCGLVADFLRGLLARPSPLTFMTSSLMSSGPLGTLVQSHEQRQPDDLPTRVIYRFNTPFADWRQPLGRAHNCWKDVVCQDLQQINLALEDVPILYQDHVSQSSKMVLIGSRLSWNEI